MTLSVHFVGANYYPSVSWDFSSFDVVKRIIVNTRRILATCNLLHRVTGFPRESHCGNSRHSRFGLGRISQAPGTNRCICTNTSRDTCQLQSSDYNYDECPVCEYKSPAGPWNLLDFLYYCGRGGGQTDSKTDIQQDRQTVIRQTDRKTGR